jgi:hypothetical protein
MRCQCNKHCIPVGWLDEKLNRLYWCPKCGSIRAAKFDHISAERVWIGKKWTMPKSRTSK